MKPSSEAPAKYPCHPQSGMECTALILDIEGMAMPCEIGKGIHGKCETHSIAGEEAVKAVTKRESGLNALGTLGTAPVEHD